MGDVSVIARRLSDKYVQYGWSGNGGYLGAVGARLWVYYNTPEMVEYLFGLGQLRHLAEPGSETTNSIFRTAPTGEAHWVGSSELDIYSKIAFVDHAYLYDSDNQWYYIAPLVVRTKLPLDTALSHITQRGVFESEFKLHMEQLTFAAMQQWHHKDKQFQEYAVKIGYDNERIAALGQMLTQVADDLSYFRDRELIESLKNLYRYFYPLAVAKVDESGEQVEEVVLRPKNALVHMETKDWDC